QAVVAVDRDRCRRRGRARRGLVLRAAPATVDGRRGLRLPGALMRRALAVGFFAALLGVAPGGGDAGSGEVASAAMALTPGTGLSPSDVGAVEILVFDGGNASCARVMSGTSPLDDAGLV